MKMLLYLLTMTLMLSASNQSNQEVLFAAKPSTRQLRPSDLPLCLTQTEAEKILGQPATLTESSTQEKDGIIRWTCTYTALSQHTHTGQPVRLYFLLERYNTSAPAHQAYQDICQSNTHMSGQAELENIGDEAWLHTDQHNFVLLISRKNNHMFRIKVNKLTPRTSLDELQKVTKNFVATL